MSPSVACSSHSPSTCTAGAPPQAARHSTGFTVNLPSPVVPPGRIPSLEQVRCISSSDPPRAQERVTQNSTRVFPSGLNRNIV